MAKSRISAGRVKSPLDPVRLNDLALSYVARFATTRAKLARYLARKLRERGWDSEAHGDGVATCEAIVMRMTELGYIDDQHYAAMRGRAMTDRGLGARRVRAQLWVDGIAPDDGEAAVEAAVGAAPASAIRFAKRRRFGPFAREKTDDPAQHQRQLAAFLRAGHAMDLARRILALVPGDEAGLAALDADAVLD